MEIKNTITALRVIYEDMIQRGMTKIPTGVLKNVKLSSSFSDLFPTDEDIINLFKLACKDQVFNDDSSLFTCEELNKSILEGVVCFREKYNKGEGNEAVIVFEYTLLTGENLCIYYEGIYSSWDSTSWEYMGYCPEPKPYTAYFYPTTDSIAFY